MPQLLSRLMAALGLIWLLTLAGTNPADAQGAATLGLAGDNAAAEDATTALADAIRQAAESGVSVVVVDSNGNLVSTAAPIAEPDAQPAAGDGMEGGSVLMKAQSEIQTFRQKLTERLEAWPQSINEVKFILRATSPDGRIMTYVEVLIWSIVLFLVARFVTTEIYGKRFARGIVTARVHENPQGYIEKMPFLVVRFFLGVFGSLFAMIVAYTIGTLIFGRVDDVSLQFTITAIYVAYFVIRTVSDLWRMILSPYMSQHRIPAFSDRDAKRLYFWAWVLAGYDVSGYVFATWIADFGLNYNVYAILYGGLALLGAFANILMVVFNGRAISNAIRNGRSPDEVSWLTRFVSYAWAPVLILLVVYGWFRLAFDLVLENPVSIPIIAGAYVVLTSVIVVYGLINYAIESYFERARVVEEINREMAEADAEGDDSDLLSIMAANQPTYAITTYEQLARRVAGILAFVAGIFALIQIWGVGGTWFAEEALLGRLIDVMVIIFIGYILYNFFRIWIDSKIAEEGGDMEEAELGDEGGAGSASRLATLLPLFRGAILAVVVISIALIALLELGINVSPLFAGAGVVGLAVGFGAQTLVRDIFSGAFFLIDDAFRKGEYIDIGDVKGTVEKISVRSFQLRHHLGALNTIPFGEIQVLTNYSRDWVIMKLPLRVTYDTDVEKVRKLIKNLGIELLDDPVIGQNFIQPLKSQGVIEMQDSAMIIRVKFMTKPGDQWLVRKRVYEEIRQLFEREGIKFAHREVTVRLADENAENLTPKQKEAVTGAVQAAIDDDLMEDVNSGDDR